MPSKRAGSSSEWVRSYGCGDGIELLEAAFERHVYDRHFHDTIAIGVTLRGVQRFWCRGATYDSTPGDLIVINPGDVHDGRSGAAGGYAYRMFYIPIETWRPLADDGSSRAARRFFADGPLLRDRPLSRQFSRTWKAMAAGSGLAAAELLSRSLASLAARHGRARPSPAEALNRKSTFIGAFEACSVSRRVSGAAASRVHSEFVDGLSE